MTQEEIKIFNELHRKFQKELLLKDLCARLPYGVWVQYTQKIFAPQREIMVDVKIEVDDMLQHRLKLLDFKPYLRPMDSMTKKEKRTFNEFGCGVLECSPSFEIEEFYGVVDWLNAHHFDYRGLIDKGLALEAPEGMYKTE